MLKLKDIFNIDISSKGGSKLYKKIMRKYNIPLKDVKEVKQEIAECSSSNNELLYYYKWKDDADKFNEVVNLLGSILRIKNIVIEGQLLYSINDYYTGEDLLNRLLMQNSDAFCIFGEETPIMTSSRDIVVIPRGNAINKSNKIIEIYPGDSFEAQQMFSIIVDFINNNLTEITKEEYESLITQ